MDTVTIIYIQRQNKRKINGLNGVEYILTKLGQQYLFNHKVIRGS